GPNVSVKTRLIYAFVGGTIMGFGAKMARGCTSGLALTGGALLSLSGWAFMLAVFGGGYAVAYFVRRQWL
ncbi:MAG: YeeE/YedE thiosulfate transporter family protein, partial [Melioribacteraceae bacterium]